MHNIVNDANLHTTQKMGVCERKVSRMLDRENVIKGLFEMAVRDTWKDIDPERSRFQPVLNDALELLKEQQPKKAKWKAVHYIRKEGTKTFKKCTCCDYTCNGWDIETGIAYDYCPNCGAEMQNGNTNRDSK